MNKPIKPNITIPESFAENGIKTDFDSDLMTEGFDSLNPDVLAGDNLNKFIDDTYKGLNYGMAAADAINLINEGETLTVIDGKLTSGSIGANTDLTNLTNTGKEFASGLPMPSDRYIDLTLGANGTEYTAPANGWVSFGRALGDGEFITLSCNGVASVCISRNVQNPTVSIPVTKGSTFIATYIGTGGTFTFKFIYAEGAE